MKRGSVVPKRLARPLFHVLLGLAFVAYLWSRSAELDVSWRVLAAIPVAWLAVALHEVGHLAGGRLAGFRAFLFACGPLLVLREGDGFRVRWNRSPMLWLGAAGSGPTDFTDLRRRAMLYLAGGPLASLVIGAGVLSIALATASSPVDVDFLVGTFGMLSTGIGLLTLLPLVPYSDGLRLAKVALGGPEAEREIAGIALSGFIVGAERPRDWPRELVDRAVGEADGSRSEMFGRLLAITHMLDTGDVDGVREQLRRVLAHVDVLPGPGRQMVHLEAAFVAAHHDGDTARARAHLARSGRSVFLRAHRSVVEAAIAIGDGDREGAATLLAAAENAIPRAQPGDDARMLVERIELLRSACARPTSG